MSIKHFFSNIIAEMISWILFLLVRFSYLTSRKEFINKALFDSVAAKGSPVIYMCWHGRLYIVPNIRPRQKDCDCIVSNNKDGEVIASVLKKMGFGLIRGSANKTKEEGVLFTKDKGGMKVFRSSLKALKAGRSLGITPDGPRGPANKIKLNALTLASMSGVRILTFTFSAKRSFRFNSWDRFMFPMPFTKIYVKFGDFFQIDKEVSEEELIKISQKIEKNLDEITEEVDKLAGVN